MRRLAFVILRILGWRVEGGFDENKADCIIVVAPHTSQWDFVWGLLARTYYDVKVKYLIKKSFFKPGIAWFFRYTGGIAVDRSQKNELTNQLKEMLNSGVNLKVAFTPEGTRSKVDKWKTGFYWTAIDTGLPILMQSLDYGRKTIGQSELFYPTGDWEKDKEVFEEFYRDVTPKRPEKFSLEF